MQIPKKRIHAAFYFLYYAYLGLFRPFLPSFLKESGLVSAQIGHVFVIISVATFFLAPMWGKRADRYGLRSIFLISFPILSSIIMAPLFFNAGFWQSVGIALLQGALIVPLIPLADSVTMERCDQNGWGYGRLRLWGTVGFLISSGCGGFLADRFGWTVVMVIMLGLTVLMAYSGYLLRASINNRGSTKTKEDIARDEVKVSDYSPLHNPVIFLFLLGTVLYQTAFGAYNLFFGIHVEQLTGSAKWISISWMIATFSEIIFFSQSDKLIKKIRPEGLIGLAMLGGVVRWGVMAYAESISVILVLQLIHGVMLGGFTTGTVAFAHRLFPSKSKAYGQGLHNAAYNGVGGVFAAYLAGYMYQNYGASVAFGSSFVLSIVAVIVLMFCNIVKGKIINVNLAKESAI